MPRLLLLAALLPLAGCSLVTGTDPGEFEATVTGAIPLALSGTAISDVIEGVGVVTLFAGGSYRGSQVQIAVLESALDEGVLAFGSSTADATLTFTFDSGAVTAGGGGQLTYVANAGTVTLTRVEGGEIEGRFEAQAVRPDGEVALTGSFRAPRAFNP